MRDKISLTLSNTADIRLAYTVFDYLQRRLNDYALDDIHSAFKELLENIIMHAYERTYDINLVIDFLISSCQLQIDIEDNGIPFDFSRYLSEPIDHSAPHDKGFYRIYDLVDRFYFTPLPNAGKRFTLLRSFDRCFDIKTNRAIEENINKEKVLSSLVVRSFTTGDGDGIAKLIYRNYDYTYYKHLFYEPHEVRHANESGDVHSIVAIYDHHIIGHFALVRTQFSNIAEIAVATVDPRFKRMGIMNRMFDYLILKAKELGFQAIFGEAIMLHPYSQKANLSHGMIECAIILGEVPAQIEIEHTTKNRYRSAAMIAYLLFDKHPRYITKSKVYGESIMKVYKDAEVPLKGFPPLPISRDSVSYRINRSLNVGIIRLEGIIEEREFVSILDDLLKEHCDMVYADINLHRIPEIDDLITMINRHVFFYSGVFFAFYDGEDYLRLQHVNSNRIDEEHLIYYSSNAKAMLDLIKQDEQRVMNM